MSIVIKLRDDGLQLLFLLKRSAHVRRDKVHVVLLDVHLDIRHELARRVADRIAQVHVRQQGRACLVVDCRELAPLPSRSTWSCADFSASPATSADSERTFSLSGLFVSPLQATTHTTSRRSPAR
jgi:hypothetical protein